MDRGSERGGKEGGEGGGVGLMELGNNGSLLENEAENLNKALCLPRMCLHPPVRTSVSRSTAL